MFKISLDAGHGLDTPGKRVPDNSLHEWQFNSAVVGYMVDELAFYENVAVLRADDPTGKRDVPLKERTDRVNGWGSNIHLSIHANAFGNSWSDACGLETFVYKKSLKEAVDLANQVQNSIVQATGLKNRGVKEGDLHMVRETKMTSILVEGPFMSNQQEAELLKSDVFRKKYAMAIVAGIVAKYGLKKTLVESQKNQVPQSISQGIGTIEMAADSVVRKDPTAYSDIVGNVKAGGKYIVHEYKDGWLNIGGWVHKDQVKLEWYDVVIGGFHQFEIDAAFAQVKKSFPGWHTEKRKQ